MLTTVNVASVTKVGQELAAVKLFAIQIASMELAYNLMFAPANLDGKGLICQLGIGRKCYYGVSHSTRSL